MQQPEVVLPMMDTRTDALYQQHAASLFTYVYRHTKTREDAEDIVVETFISAIEDHKFSRLDERQQTAWLWRVARNKVIDAYRRAKVRRHAPLEIISETMYADEQQEPEQTALQREETEQVQALLQRLPPAYQEILHLRFGQNMRSAEIASIIGKRETSVRATLSRALKMLRRIYVER
jgi:RNA polymerase sigma-70 factor (ECF subfamily)